MISLFQGEAGKVEWMICHTISNHHSLMSLINIICLSRRMSRCHTHHIDKVNPLTMLAPTYSTAYLIFPGVKDVNRYAKHRLTEILKDGKSHRLLLRQGKI